MDKASMSKQDFWLNHIKQARKQKLTLAKYAKQHKLSDKSIYRWKKVLTQRGLLSVENTGTPFVQVVTATEETPQSSVEIAFANGHRLSLQSTDQSTLVALVTTLRCK